MGEGGDVPQQGPVRRGPSKEEARGGELVEVLEAAGGAPEALAEPRPLPRTLVQEEVEGCGQNHLGLLYGRQVKMVQDLLLHNFWGWKGDEEGKPLGMKINPNL